MLNIFELKMSKKYYYTENVLCQSNFFATRKTHKYVPLRLESRARWCWRSPHSLQAREKQIDLVTLPAMYQSNE
jgi:hypothetical protein